MYKLRMMFPHRGEALISTLKIENGKQKLMPAWRQLQIAKLVGIVNLDAGDLGERYRARRIDALATVTRNLCELCVWTQYCNLSDEKAKTFFEDSARDFREIMQALQTLYTAVNGRPESDLTENIRNFQGIAEAHGIKDYDHRYVQVRDAAKDSGRGDAFSILYKIFSKLAHPTSLVLALDIKTGELSEMLDSLYVGGEQFASASLREIEKSILKIYPSLAC
jgi:hypothetical protein